MGKRIIFMWLCLTVGVGMAFGQHTIVKGFSIYCNNRDCYRFGYGRSPAFCHDCV